MITIGDKVKIVPNSDGEFIFDENRRGDVEGAFPNFIGIVVGHADEVGDYIVKNTGGLEFFIHKDYIKPFVTSWKEKFKQ
jgi:hypothetical protein